MAKLCAENCYSVDTRRLKAFEDEHGQPVYNSCARITCIQENGGVMAYTVNVTWTPCHFGKMRPWFSCPQCHKRIGKLFYRAQRFACRHCQQLCYASQLENVGQRGLGLSQKLYNQFDGDDEMIYKPKGMHWATFDRILARAEEAEYRSMEGVLQWAGKLMRNFPPSTRR